MAFIIQCKVATSKSSPLPQTASSSGVDLFQLNHCILKPRRRWLLFSHSYAFLYATDAETALNRHLCV
ncbi:hypothetical protein VNO80_10806 [Phaseolus coccineus]|uniref:Uncharacterized protein n=1 Tax=Phaseolus coccineus TaxID=3886 RepID=A0AAN9N9C6_PHACN